MSSDSKQAVLLYGSGYQGSHSGSSPQRPEYYQRPAADWELWAHMPKATVREAVALSLGVEPRPPALEWWQYETPKQYTPHPKEFARRLALATAYVDAAGPLRPLGPMPTLNGAESATVYLAEFRAWAEGLGWELPARFPQTTAAHVAAAAVLAPVEPERKAPAPAATAPVKNKLNGRANPLAAVLTLARQRAIDPTDWASVWAALVTLAQSPQRPAPLLGYVDGEGVKYQNDDAEKPVRYFTSKALRKRFERGAVPSQTPTDAR